MIRKETLFWKEIWITKDEKDKSNTEKKRK